MRAKRTATEAVAGEAGYAELALDGLTVSLLIKRNNRARRISLRLDADGGHLVLVLPPRASASAGVAFARSQSDWVRERLSRRLPHIPFNDGAMIPYLGQPHVLTHRPGMRGGVWVEDGRICVAGGIEYLPRRVADWLKRRAREELLERTARMAAEIGRSVERLSVGDPVSRWGSCSASGRLAFSWRLILTPPEVLTYVAAHEVAHLAEMNHSPAFWAVVEKLVAEPRRTRAWLKDNGAELRRYG